MNVVQPLGRGKHVVTANKALLGAYLDDVIALCESHPYSRLGFEAAVAGGEVNRLIAVSSVTSVLP